MWEVQQHFSCFVNVSLFEPTCTYCKVDSYTSLSVCSSVCHWTIIHISGSIIHVARNLKPVLVTAVLHSKRKSC